MADFDDTKMNEYRQSRDESQSNRDWTHYDGLYKREKGFRDEAARQNTTQVRSQPFVSSNADPSNISGVFFAGAVICCALFIIPPQILFWLIAPLLAIAGVIYLIFRASIEYPNVGKIIGLGICLGLIRGVDMVQSGFSPPPDPLHPSSWVMNHLFFVMMGTITILAFLISHLRDSNPKLFNIIRVIILLVVFVGLPLGCITGITSFLSNASRNTAYPPAYPAQPVPAKKQPAKKVHHK